MPMRPPTLAEYGKLLLIEFTQYRRLRADGLHDHVPDYTADLVSWFVDIAVPLKERPFFDLDIVYERWIEILDNGTEEDAEDFPRWIVQDSQRRRQLNN